MLKKLREVRKKNNITITEMSKLLGYKSHSTYAKKELGQISITIEEAKKIAKILNTNVSELFFYK